MPNVCDMGKLKKLHRFQKKRKMKEEDEKSNEESKIKVWVRIRPTMHESSSSLCSQGNSIKIKKKTFTYVNQRFAPRRRPSTT